MMCRREMGKVPGMKGAGKRKGEAAQRLIMGLTAQFRNTFEDDEGSESVEFAGTMKTSDRADEPDEARDVWRKDPDTMDHDAALPHEAS